MAGRWLDPGDDDVVVLNHMAAATLPGVTPGQSVTISVGGDAHDFRVADVVRDLGSPATAYVPARTFGRLTRTTGMTELLAVTTAAQDAAARAEAIGRVERALEDAGVRIDVSIPVEMLETAVGEHMAVVLGLILGLAALMTLVGLLGLAAAMSTAVIERTRELGVMRAVGASPGLTLHVILGEGVLIGASSGMLAVAVAVPLSALVGRIIGLMAFRALLPLVMSPGAVFTWLAIVVGCSAIATAIPALRASRITVREALAYN